MRYRGYDVWEIPPNGQGIAALAALGILDGFNFATATAEQRLHLQIEAMKLGFADAHAYVADPETPSVHPPPCWTRPISRGGATSSATRPATRHRATRLGAAPSTSAPPTRTA